MPRNAESSWIEEPSRLRQAVDSCKSAHNADRNLSRHFLQLRYARPTSIGNNTGGGADRSAPIFIDGFLPVIKQLGYNQFLEVSDACTAKICQPLRPRVVPVAAKPNIHRNCTLYNRLIDGVLESCNFLEEATSAWEDSYCVPVGFVLFEIERNIGQIICRQGDGMHLYWRRGEGRNPIHLYYEEPVSRVVVLERYPEYEADIMRAPTWQPPTILGVDPPTDGGGEEDTIRLIRGWRRRTGDSPGKYVCAIESTVLNGGGDGEEWPYDFFPIAVARNRWARRGFGGIPMGMHVAPHHLAINRLARVAEDSFKGAIPFLMSHQDSAKNEMTDVPFQVFKWKGQHRPEVIANNPVSEQVLRRIDYHDAKAYAVAGINKAMAHGEAPKGVTAAVAMREIQAFADARAAEYQKHWESMYRQAGHIIVAFANELKKMRVPAHDAVNAELMEEIDMKAIAMEKTDYRISYGLSSALSKSIPGLISDLGDFKDLGLVNLVDMAMAIGDKVPDLQYAMDRVTAHQRLASKMVQDALEKGEIPVVPSAQQGQQGLDAIVLLGQQAWSAAMINPDRYPAKNLEALRMLMKVAQSKKGAPAPVQPTGTPGQALAPNAMTTVGTPAPVQPVQTPAPMGA